MKLIGPELLLKRATMKRSALTPRNVHPSNLIHRTSPKPSDPADIEEAKRRFAICIACEHARDDGFACDIYTGCCLGRFRAVAGSHCPAGKW